MAETVNGHSIGLIVEADSPKEALGALLDGSEPWEGFVDRNYPGAIYSLPLPLASTEARDRLTALWGLQHLTYMEDLQAITIEISCHDYKTDAAHLLNSLSFRAACYRLGAIEGHPVRIYDPMATGIIFFHGLDRLVQGKPIQDGEPLAFDPERLWLVLLDIETSKKGGAN